MATLLVCACHRAPSTAPSTTVVVESSFPPGTDMRDVLDRGLPAIGMQRPSTLVTRDPNLLAYAARSAEYRIDALPWSTTYVLAVAGADSTSAIPTAAERDAIARDAVSTDARGSVEPFPWLSSASCAVDVPPAELQARPTRAIIAYAAGDNTAREIAERIAARSPAAPRVASVPADSLAAVLATGRAAAVVFAIARDAGTSCGTRDNVLVIRGAVPLVDTRAHVITRRSAP